MGWEKRSERASYYYRSERRNGKAERRYLGRAGSPPAELASHEDEARRSASRAARAERSCWQEAVQAVDDFARLTRRLVHATLLANGYHRPGRHAWRKKR